MKPTKGKTGWQDEQDQTRRYPSFPIHPDFMRERSSWIMTVCGVAEGRLRSSTRLASLDFGSTVAAKASDSSVVQSTHRASVEEAVLRLPRIDARFGEVHPSPVMRDSASQAGRWVSRAS